MSEAPTQQKTHRKHQMAGYYTAKRAALRADGSRVDARYRKNKEILADRAAFKRLCGRTGYTVKRRELWKIVEKFKRVLNAVEPVVFARPSLVNKRYKIIMPLCMDYVGIVGKYQDALVKAFDGLPDARPEPDLLTRLQRAASREERRKSRQNGKPYPTKPDDGDTLKDPTVVEGGGGGEEPI